MGDGYLIQKVPLSKPPLQIPAFDLFTGMTVSDARGINLHDQQSLVVFTRLYHARGRFYRDFGTNSGSISFNYEYRIGQGGSSTANWHSIWRVMNGLSVAGTNYNNDGYTGWELYYEAGTVEKIHLCSYGTHSVNTGPITRSIKNWSLPRGTSARISLDWNTLGVNVWINGELYIYKFDSPVTDLTYVEKGFAMYNGQIFMEIVAAAEAF
jgi:hypothetical protein